MFPIRPGKRRAWLQAVKGMRGLVISYAITVLLWYGLGLRMGPDIFPGPLRTVVAVGKILSNANLTKHVGITFGRTVGGVILSMFIAAVAVLGARYWGPFRYYFLRVFYPAMRAIPPVAVALLAIVWFGLGTGTVIFVIVITVLPIYMIDLWEGLKVIDATLVEMASVLTSNRTRILKKVVFPMLVPVLFSSTKLSFSVAFKLALIGELLGATSGMGFMVYQSQQEYKTDMVFAWTFLLVLLVVFLEFYFFDLTERKYLYKWQTPK